VKRFGVPSASMAVAVVALAVSAGGTASAARYIITSGSHRLSQERCLLQISAARLVSS
jgi:hypothetical protein